MLLIKRRYLIILLIFAVCLSSALFIINSDGYKSQLKQIGYHNLQRLKSVENDDVIRVYRANSEILQIVASEGYNGDIIILVSIKEDKITMVDILDHDETEDYGGYIVEEWFLNRLCLPIDNELNTVKMKKVKSNDVVAVTGATISSNAVVDGVNKCIKNYGGLRDE